MGAGGSQAERPRRPDRGESPTARVDSVCASGFCKNTYLFSTLTRGSEHKRK